MSFLHFWSIFVIFLFNLFIQGQGEIDSPISTLTLEVVNTYEKRFLGEQAVNGHKQDCCSIQLAGNTKSGIYRINPYENDPRRGITVYCDLITDGGGWTVIQRREPVTGPTERFYRNWKSYEDGFGQLGFSHWLGLENIAALTAGYDQFIRFDLEDWEGQKRHATYLTFFVGGKEEKYKLDVGNYTGDAGNSFIYHNGNKFSTKDEDNDKWPNSCVHMYKGAWWQDACHESNLNGLYVVNGSHVTFADGVNWKEFQGYHHSLKRTEMKIRNKNFSNGCRSA